MAYIPPLLEQTNTNVVGRVAPVAHITGGATPFRIISAATTNATLVKNAPGQIYSIMATNTNATVS